MCNGKNIRRIVSGDIIEVGYTTFEKKTLYFYSAIKYDQTSKCKKRPS